MGGVVGTAVVMVMSGVVARAITICTENWPLTLRRLAHVASLWSLNDTMNQRGSQVGTVG